MALRCVMNYTSIINFGMHFTVRDDHTNIETDNIVRKLAEHVIQHRRNNPVSKGNIVNISKPLLGSPSN